MIRRLVNLPFKVLGKAARAVQAREEAALAQAPAPAPSPARVPKFDTPPDYAPKGTAVTAKAVLADRAAGREPVFVDLRARPAGGIPGALHVPYATLDIGLAELPPAGQPIVVYDEDGQVAPEAVRFLRWRGIDDAVSLDGGLVAWRAAGGPTDRG